ATEWPTHYANKGLVLMRQLNNLLRYLFCICSITARIRNQEANQNAIVELQTIVERFLCDISPLQVVPSDTDGSAITGEHGAYYDRNIWIAERHYTLVFKIDKCLSVVCIDRNRLIPSRYSATGVSCR